MAASRRTKRTVMHTDFAFCIFLTINLSSCLASALRTELAAVVECQQPMEVNRTFQLRGRSWGRPRCLPSQNPPALKRIFAGASHLRKFDVDRRFCRPRLRSRVAAPAPGDPCARQRRKATAEQEDRSALRIE